MDLLQDTLNALQKQQKQSGSLSSIYIRQVYPQYRDLNFKYQIDNPTQYEGYSLKNIQEDLSQLQQPLQNSPHNKKLLIKRNYLVALAKKTLENLKNDSKLLVSPMQMKRMKTASAKTGSSTKAKGGKNLSINGKNLSITQSPNSSSKFSATMQSPVDKYKPLIKSNPKKDQQYIGRKAQTDKFTVSPMELVDIVEEGSSGFSNGDKSSSNDKIAENIQESTSDDEFLNSKGGPFKIIDKSHQNHVKSAYPTDIGMVHSFLQNGNYKSLDQGGAIKKDDIMRNQQLAMMMLNNPELASSIHEQISDTTTNSNWLPSIANKNDRTDEDTFYLESQHLRDSLRDSLADPAKVFKAAKAVQKAQNNFLPELKDSKYPSQKKTQSERIALKPSTINLVHANSDQPTRAKKPLALELDSNASNSSKSTSSKGFLEKQFRILTPKIKPKSPISLPPRPVHTSNPANNKRRYLVHSKISDLFPDEKEESKQGGMTGSTYNSSNHYPYDKDSQKFSKTAQEAFSTHEISKKPSYERYKEQEPEEIQEEITKEEITKEDITKEDDIPIDHSDSIEDSLDNKMNLNANQSIEKALFGDGTFSNTKNTTIDSNSKGGGNHPKQSGHNRVFQTQPYSSATNVSHLQKSNASSILRNFRISEVQTVDSEYFSSQRDDASSLKQSSGINFDSREVTDDSINNRDGMLESSNLLQAQLQSQLRHNNPDQSSIRTELQDDSINDRTNSEYTQEQSSYNGSNNPSSIMSQNSSSLPQSLAALEYKGTLKKKCLLGGGGEARVYLCEFKEYEDLVALKQYDVVQNGKEKDDAYRSLKVEFNMLRNMRHDNIIQYYCLYKPRKIKYANCLEFGVIMEYMPGGSLLQYLEESYSELSFKSKIDIMEQILKGIQHLHQQNIIHRDLKPANILLSNDRSLIKITDFGISIKTNNDSSTKRTLVGTPWYMAPEVINEEPYTSKADIWSIGCCFFHLITGKKPYHTSNRIQALMLMVNNQSPLDTCDSESKKAIDEHPAFRDLLTQCFSRDKSKRPTALDLLKHAAFQQEPLCC